MLFNIKTFVVLIIASAVMFCNYMFAIAYPVEFVDDRGNTVVITKRPSSVVPLVPSVAEILFRINAGDTIKAITYHSTYPPEISNKEIVGGFFSPSLEKIETMQPDLIFYSSLHKKVVEKFGNGKCKLINIEVNSVQDAYDSIMLLGKIFDRKVEAAEIVDEIKDQLDIIAKKTSLIPSSKRKRVIRLMGRGEVKTPGDDSFQNELIRLAGGIPHDFNKNGKIVPVTEGEWMKFNPQFIYGCGGDRKTADTFFSQPVWKDVEAVKNKTIYYFPCDLTCRIATKTGYFVSWLAASIYHDEFEKKENLVFEEKVFESKKVDLDLDYVKDIRIDYSRIYDFVNKTLIIDFKKPLSIISTLEGQRNEIKTVGNHYSPPQYWAIGHKKGFEGQRDCVYKVIGMSKDDASFLFTGADMDNLAIKRQGFKEMLVYALVTAGVKSNAVRMSADEGMFYEPGTINIILLANMKLTPRAMTRAIIAVTEGKTAALQDLDIRSSYTPLTNPATGTGTDNVMVVEGTGKELKNAGGHSKLGELIAKAVYEGVQEAVYKQNGLAGGRNIFRRLRDRKLSVFEILSAYECECNTDKFDIVGDIEAILLQPRYASFVEASLSLSDDYERGLVSDLSSYRQWCKRVAEEIAGRKIEKFQDVIGEAGLPIVIKLAFNSILNGVQSRNQ